MTLNRIVWRIDCAWCMWCSEHDIHLKNKLSKVLKYLNNQCIFVRVISLTSNLHLTQSRLDKEKYNIFKIYRFSEYGKILGVEMPTGFYLLALSAGTSWWLASFSVKLSVASSDRRRQLWRSKLLHYFFRLPCSSQILEHRPPEQLWQHSAKGLWQASPESGPKLMPLQWWGIGCSLTWNAWPNASLIRQEGGRQASLTYRLEFLLPKVRKVKYVGKKVSFFLSIHLFSIPISLPI